MHNRRIGKNIYNGWWLPRYAIHRVETDTASTSVTALVPDK